MDVSPAAVLSQADGPNRDSGDIAAWGLPRRLVALAVLLALEWLPLSAFVQTGRGGASTARFIIAFTSLFLIFGYFRARNGCWRISGDLWSAPLSIGFLAGHFCALALFIGISFPSTARTLPSVPGEILAGLWFASGSLSLGLGVLAFIPLKFCLDFVRATGNAWAYAVLGAASAWKLAAVSWSLWDTPAVELITNVTFRFVTVLLRLFVAGVVVNPEKRILGTAHFTAIVGAPCSGIEGLGMILAFGVAWLWFFRHEVRFPHALLLIPAGLSLMWVLNAVRITALLLIGNAGAQDVAVSGFHSQAGWIAFSGVALAFAAAARHVEWLAADQREVPVERAPVLNPLTAYLAPFLAILAAALLTRAASAGFDWLYPVRFLVAVAALWSLRSRYLALDWQFDWAAPAIGTAVFMIWIVLDRFANYPTPAAIPSALAAASSPIRITWITFRALAAVTTVPIAEELAFRGFLVRRMMSSDFESVSMRRFTWFALLTSSLAFGALHGERWIAGTVAGILFGLVMVRKGRIGDAVVAHAVSNALLAGYVLGFHHWNLW